MHSKTDQTREDSNTWHYATGYHPSLFTTQKNVPKDYFQPFSSLDEMACILKRVQSQCWNTYRNETLTRAAHSVGKINDVNSFSRNSVVAAAEPVSVPCEVSEHFLRVLLHSNADGQQGSHAHGTVGTSGNTKPPAALPGPIKVTLFSHFLSSHFYLL